MNLKIQTIDIDELKQNKLFELFEKSLDVLIIKGVFNRNSIDDCLATLDKNIGKEERFHLPGGYFFPLPYAAVHGSNQMENNSLFKNYFHAANYFSSNKGLLIGIEMMNELDSFMEKLGLNKDSLVKFENGTPFSEINIRQLNSGSEGIDIHCENAFINELDENIKKQLEKKLDLLNAVSVLITLQNSEGGGCLEIFNSDWDSMNINLSDCTKAERSPKNWENFFKKFTKKDIQKNTILSEPGDVVIFRAAQLWHNVSDVTGNKPRLTAGFFSAKSKTFEDASYWA